MGNAQLCILFLMVLGLPVAQMAHLRTISKVYTGQAVTDGAGVAITRTIGSSGLRNLDPFLMLDEIKAPSKNVGMGFPSHPHRGFETCSIMLEGQMEHQDNYGNKGVIGAGGVQWMTAGRGIIHSEMPQVVDGGRLWGFQLWINLPKKDKMVKPWYQDYQATEIPVVEKDGVRVRVMAGEAAGVKGPVFMRNPGMLLDVQLQPGAKFSEKVPAEWSSFAYISDGAGKVSGTPAKAKHALVFGPGDFIEATTDDPAGMRMLVVAGKPIGEPIVQHGPFVMNTQEEISQAFRDYQSGRLQDPNDDPWKREL